MERFLCRLIHSCFSHTGHIQSPKDHFFRWSFRLLFLYCFYDGGYEFIQGTRYLCNKNLQLQGYWCLLVCFQSLVLCSGSHTNIESYELFWGLKLFSVLAVHCALSKQALLMYNSPWKFLSAIPSGRTVLLAQRCLGAVELTGGVCAQCIWTIILKAITIVGKLAAIACCCSDKLDMASAQVFKIQFCCSCKV